MNKINEVNKVFHTIGALNSLWEPVTLGRNVINNPRYRYDGSTRNVDQPHTIFQYTLSGAGEVIYKGTSHKVPTGSGFFCNSHDPNFIYQFPEGTTEKWTILYITFHNTENLCSECCAKYGPVFELYENSPILAELNRLVGSHGNHITLKKHQSLDLAAQTVSAVLNSFELMSEKKTGTITVAKVCRFISENINEPLSVNNIASVIGISREHVSRIFKIEEGISLARYIRRLKIREASRLFISGITSVKEVSTKLGFDNTSNFIRTFKKETSVTPGQFLNNHFG